MESPQLILYHRPTCSYCIQVRMAAKRLGIRLDLRDTSSDLASRQQLLDATGRTTVPVLRIETPTDTVGRGDIATTENDFNPRQAAIVGTTAENSHGIGDQDVVEPKADNASKDIVSEQSTRWLRESLAIIRYLKAHAGQPARLPVWVDRLSSISHTLSFMALVAGLLAGGPSGRNFAIGGGVIFFLAVMRRVASVLTARRVTSS